MSPTLHEIVATPDMRAIAPVHARLVIAVRYLHLARAQRTYCCRALAAHIGNPDAVMPFHVFMDEISRAWPEPVALHRPCVFRLSYDEMLLIDLCSAAAKNDRAAFDDFLEDMIGGGARNAIWTAARRLMARLVRVVP